jgi:tetratricopeptide (TPR) repeat protein
MLHTAGPPRFIPLTVAFAALLMAAGCGGPPVRTGSGAGTIEIVTHVVADGESFASIADDYYGTPEAAGYLADANGASADLELDRGALVDVPVGEEDVARYARRTEAKSRYNLGTEYAEGGELRRAAEEFREALRIDPRFVDAGYNLGVVLLMMAEPSAAVSILEQVLSVRPDDADAEFALGKAMYDSGRGEDGLTHFERALSLAPFHEEAMFARAVSLLDMGRRDDGVVALDAYLRRYPEGAWSGVARTRLIELAGSAAAERIRAGQAAILPGEPDPAPGDADGTAVPWEEGQP